MPSPIPIDVLGFLAAATSRLVLATGVLVLPAHHPVIMAKRLATLDALSKGRVRLCIGVGWIREELEACGVDFASRGRRTDECIDVMRALWADSEPEGATFAGEFFRFAHAHTHPKPRPAGGIPIHIGGHSAGLHRPGRPVVATVGIPWGSEARNCRRPWDSCARRPRPPVVIPTLSN